MKYKLKTKLFTALAISGASFFGPMLSSAFAQDNDYGFIRSIEPTRTVEVAKFVEEAAIELPPIVNGTISPAPVSQSGVSGAPMPFAASNVYAGSFIPNTPPPESASVGQRSTSDEPSVGQVGYTSNPQEVTELPPIVGGLTAERDVPPIIQRVDQSLPKIVEVVPPVRSVEVVQPSAGRPLLAPLAFSNRQEEPEAATADGTMVLLPSMIHRSRRLSPPALLQRPSQCKKRLRLFQVLLKVFRRLSFQERYPVEATREACSLR